MKRTAPEKAPDISSGAEAPSPHDLDTSPMNDATRRLVFPLDYGSLEEARAGARVVAPSVGVLKVGLELFVREGPAAIAACHDLGRDVFLDLKLHDIPETVGRAVQSAASLGVRYLTVHAHGGRAMLERAAEEATRASAPLTILAVTVLTSLDAEDLTALGLSASPAEQAERVARLAWDAGVRGFVASASEAANLRSALGPEALLVTPGIRPAGSAAGDQKRITTPAQAISSGADLLVVGRPIRDAVNPLDAARAVVAEIEGALAPRST
ncbi:MAG TPA: orotidine-5'-phosphate decarboxylase [Polyangium sp.]|nr:orotidine-5'-phosphate decarboxylase [Polyangium sp.]